MDKFSSIYEITTIDSIGISKNPPKNEQSRTRSSPAVQFITLGTPRSVKVKISDLLKIELVCSKTDRVVGEL